MLVHRRVNPNIKFAGTHLYTLVERGTVRVKCVAQEHNAMTPARARTRAPRPGDERTNHEATGAPYNLEIVCLVVLANNIDTAIYYSVKENNVSAIYDQGNLN